MKHHPKRERVRQTARPSSSLLERLQAAAAGIDCGPNSHFVAVPPDRAPQPVRAFRSFTAELERLADGLGQCRSQSVAMESTGLFWSPLYEILAQRGFAVMLVNAREVPHLRGRQREVMDGQWLRELPSVGRLRPRFRPAAALVPQRSFMRQRETWVEAIFARILRMPKALTPINVMLQVVVSDLTGETALKLRNLWAGERAPQRLAAHRNYRGLNRGGHRRAHRQLSRRAAVRA